MRRDRSIEGFSEQVGRRPVVEAVAACHDPRCFEVLLARGSMKAERRDFDGAWEDLTAASRIDPEHPKPFHRRGDVWRKWGCLEQAIADYADALRLAPNDGEVRKSFERAFEKRGMAGAARSQPAINSTSNLTPQRLERYLAESRVTRLCSKLVGRGVDLVEKAGDLVPFALGLRPNGVAVELKLPTAIEQVAKNEFAVYDSLRAQAIQNNLVVVGWCDEIDLRLGSPEGAERQARALRVECDLMYTSRPLESPLGGEHPERRPQAGFQYIHHRPL